MLLQAEQRIAEAAAGLCPKGVAAGRHQARARGGRAQQRHALLRVLGAVTAAARCSEHVEMCQGAVAVLRCFSARA